MRFLGRVFLKILFFPLTRIFIAIFAIALVFGLESSGLQVIGEASGQRRQAWYIVLSGAIQIVSVCLVYAGYVWLFERRRAVELSKKNALREFATGAAIGFGLFTATIACLWLGRYYRVEGIGRVPSAATLMGLGFVAAFLEEIIVRGVIYRITEESLGTWLAIAISALFFGFSHIFNPESNVIAALCIAVEAGVLLAAAYITTRRLWLPIGLHFAWNFTQGGVFGVAVSGMPVRGMLRSSLTGPEYLTGGAFGAESSIFAVLVCTSMAIYLIVRAVRNDQIVRPFWSRPKAKPTSVALDELIA
jgi:membrane protease YdiL (CAAX protease family)